MTYEKEVYEAYKNIVGEEYYNEEEADEAYQGYFYSDEDFAKYIAEETGAYESGRDENNWPHYCIDWEWAARELMMDYSEDSGYYFRNL